MLKRLLFAILVILSASFANAEEVTPAPEFVVQDNVEVWFVEAVGQGEIHLFLDNVEVENPYTIALTYEEQYFNFSAYAQLEGCLPSEIVDFEVVVPPVETPSPGPEFPEIRSSVTDESVIIQAFWDACVDDYNLMLFVDGIQVDNPCVLPRCDEDYLVYAVALLEYDNYSLDTRCEILVPALEENRATTYVTMNDERLLVFPDSCLASVDNQDGMLIFTALDGSLYSYPIADVTAMEQQLTKELPTINSYAFDHKYNYQVYTDAAGTIDSDEIHVVVAGIGKRLTASFDLSDRRAVAIVDGTVQQSTVSRLRFDSSRVYTVGYRGDSILAPTADGNHYALKPFGREYTVTVDFLTDHSTSVPRIDINTVDGVDITSREVYVDAEIIIDGAGVFPSMTDSVKIKGRGNFSWSDNPGAKNPYRLKFAKKVRPLGLTYGKNWVLLANSIMGSAMTNAIGMKAASLLGTAVPNHIVPVELYINGEYRGSYNFTEKVGFSNNSINIPDESAATLLECDTYYDEIEGQKFTTSPYGFPVNVKEPEFYEGGTLLTLNDIRTRANAFFKAVKDGTDLADHVDIGYLASFLMLNEYICNVEIFHPKSTYCYHKNILEDSCKFIFGPVWDLDWGFGGSPGNTYFTKRIEFDYYKRPTTYTQYRFWNNVRANPKVARGIYEVWKRFSEDGLEELCEFVTEYYNYAKPSLDHNSEAGKDRTDYSAQAPQAVNWLRQRAAYISQQMAAEFKQKGDVNSDRTVSIADLACLINCLLAESTSSLLDPENADVNSDGMVNISDVSALIILLLTTN